MHRSSNRRERGQIIVIAALGMVAFIGLVALVLEGGNAYAQQRVTQNTVDAAANAGAVVIAQSLGGVAKTTTDVAAAMSPIMAPGPTGLDLVDARFTNVTGQLLTPFGVVTPDRALAARVGTDAIPPAAQGVSVAGQRTFGTSFARVYRDRQSELVGGRDGRGRLAGGR